MEVHCLLLQNRELVRDDTGWLSPSNVIAENVYENNNWLNLDNIMYYNDSTYATVPNGVSMNVKSQTISCTGFNFNIKEDATVTGVDVRIKVLDGTKGGSAIKDCVLTINGENVENNQKVWSDQLTLENIYTSTVTNLENLTIKYQIIGTGEDYNQPLIYGLQVKINYEYYAEIDHETTTTYETKATLSETKLTTLEDSTKLTISREVLNAQKGLYSTLHVKLSDELRFSDGKQEKLFDAVNTTELWKDMKILTIKPVMEGVGTITISSSSMNEEILLYCFVSLSDFAGEFTSLNNTQFINNVATVRGGAVFNNQNLDNQNAVYEQNSAVIEGNDVYVAKTILNPKIQEEYALHEVTTINVEVIAGNNSKINHGSVRLYLNDTVTSISASVVNGIATIQTNAQLFNKLGQHKITFKYEGYSDTNGLKYGKSEYSKYITITPQITTIELVNDTIQQYEYCEIKLKDGNGNAINGETVEFIFPNQNTSALRQTDSNGIAHFLINWSVGTYPITLKYNGSTNYKESESNTSLKVTLKPTSIISEDKYLRKGLSDNYSLRLNDEDGNGLANKTINTIITNITSKTAQYTKTTSSNGVINLPINLGKDVYIATNTFKTDNVYESIKNTDKIIVYDAGVNETKINLDEQNVLGIDAKNTQITGSIHDVLADVKIPNQTIYMVLTTSDDTTAKIYKTTADKFGNFLFDIKIGKGNYTYDCTYLGSNAYDGTIESGTISIIEEGSVETVFESTDYEYIISNNKDYIAQLTDADNNPLADKEVIINIKTRGATWDKYVTKTNQYGYFYYPLNLTEGIYSVELSFLGDRIYKHCNKTNYILVEGKGSTKTEVKYINTSDFGFYDSDKQKNISFQLISNNNPLKNKYCNLVVYDENKQNNILSIVTNEKGSISYDIPKTAGMKLVDAWFVGDSIYSPSWYTTCVFVQKTKGTITSIEGTNIEMYQGEEHFYKAKLTDVDGNALMNQEIITEVINSDKTRKYFYNSTDAEGYISISIDLDVDIYKVISYFAPSDDSQYRSCYCENVVKVLQNKNLIPTSVTASDVTQDYTSTDTFDVTLKNLIDNTTIANKDITFEIIDSENKSNIRTAVTDANGVAHLELTEYEGTYLINYTFLGDVEYNQSINTNNLQIVVTDDKKTTIESYDTNLTYSSTNAGNLNVKLVHSLIGLSDKSIRATFVHRTTHEVITRTATTIAGRVQFDVTGFIIGKYDVFLDFDGDMDYKPSTKQVELNISDPSDMDDVLVATEKDYYITTYKESTILTAELLTESENKQELIGDYVLFDFYDRENKKYSFMSIIGDDYTAKFNTNLLEGGYYDCYITYPSQTIFKTAMKQIIVNVTQRNTVIEINDQIITYYADEYVTATLTDDIGNALPNEYVLMSIGNSTNGYSVFNALTDANGVANVLVDLPVGIYEISCYNITGKNYSQTNASANLEIVEAETTLSAPNKQYYVGDNKLYRCRLLSKNKPVTDVELILNVDGVEYSQLTDSDGYVNYEILVDTSGTYTVSATVNDSNFEDVTDTGQVTIIKRELLITIGELDENNHAIVNVKDNKGQNVQDHEIIMTLGEIE